MSEKIVESKAFRENTVLPLSKAQMIKRAYKITGVSKQTKYKSINEKDLFLEEFDEGSSEEEPRTRNLYLKNSTSEKKKRVLYLSNYTPKEFGTAQIILTPEGGQHLR